MATAEDKHQAAIIIRALRGCLDDVKVVDYCHKCPFDDGIHNCIDYLHITAADLLEKLAGLRK